MIIGLSGYARSGKDSVADILVANHGYQRVAFADKLREMLYALNPIVAWQDADGDIIGDYYLQEVINDVGWDGYKETHWGPEIRRLLQRLGTEAGRDVLGENVWVDAAFNGVTSKNIVVTDCRFPNEAKGVRDRYGVVWRVERPGVGPANSHASETSLDNWNFDVTVKNDGTLQDLSDRVGRILEFVR